MAERREERDLSGAGGLNNPLLDDLLLSAAAAAASGSNQPNSGNMPGPGSQQQQYQYQSWTSSFDHLNLPSAYSGWYGQPTGMNFGTGADLLSGSFPHYDDLLQATVNQGTVADDPLLSKPAFYGSDGPPSTSVPTRGNMSSGTFHATQQGMVFPPPGGTTPSLGGGGGFQMGEQPAEGQGSYVSSANDFAFPNAAADGRSMYADAMNRWDMYQGSIFSAFQEPKPVDPSPWENQNLNRQTPVVTSSPGFIHSPPPPIPTPPGREVPQDTRQSVHGIANVTDQSVKNLADQLLEGIGASSTTTATTSNNSSAAASSPSPQQPSTANTNALNSRPSYSDVAKHAKTSSSSNMSKQQQKSAATDWLSDDSLPPEFPSAPVNLKPPQRQKSKSSRHSHKTKSDPESSVKPDSKYGLDMFEDVGRDKGRSHSSECSTPQSRKSSASSVTSASSGGLEDASHSRHIGDISNQHKPRNPLDAVTHPKVNAYDTADVVGVVGSKYDIRKGDLKNHHKFSQGTQAHAQETRAGSASPHISTQPKHKKPNSESTKSNQTQPKAFFDPKRIFQTHTASSSSKQQSGKSGGTEKSSIPNNQQPAAAGNRRDRPEVLLNNGKPTSSLFSGGNVGKPSNTTYINNDLRQHKKQTNTEERNSPHRSGAADPHQDDHHHHRRSTGGVRGHRQDHVTSESQSGHQGVARSSSTGRRKKAEPTGSGSKKQTSGNEDRPKRKKQKDDGPNPLNVFYEWAWAAWVWLKWGVLELCYVIWNVAVILFKLFLVLVFLIVQYILVLCEKVWSFLQRKIPFFRRFKSSGTWSSSSNHRKYGLEENITLPTTGDEAMRRLLACRGKDPYTILGVRCDASDEEIKRYYRKQAVLVHPDKNQQPGAEESFKILGAAFELIGEPDKRRKFDSHRTETQEMEDDMKQFADLLTKLQEKVQEAANLMRCENCGGKHKRFPVERAWYDARFCDKCNTRHSAKEGDVWAESRMLGFLWHYYACMEGKVYDITEWASCQKNHFKHMQANAHQVIYRIATNANKRGKGQGGSEELEDFLNQLFHHAARSDGAGAGAASSGAESPNYGAWDKDNMSGSAWSRSGGGPSPPPGAAAASAGGKRRKKKRKH